MQNAKPAALITANIHGNEVISSEVALAILTRLTTKRLDDSARELLDLCGVTVIPAVNLDSRETAARALCAGSFYQRAPRGNKRGVDLNRNFPYPKDARDVWHPLSGTRHAWLPWYRGEEPLSEPESRALADLTAARPYVAAINLHSVGRLFLYPYCYTPEEPADVAAFRAMGDAFVSAQTVRPYAVKQSRSWYTVLGDLDDWLYDTHGTLSVTVELARPLGGLGNNPLRLFAPLAWMNPVTPEPAIDNTVTACLRALTEAVRQKA